MDECSQWKENSLARVRNCSRGDQKSKKERVKNLFLQKKPVLDRLLFFMLS